jgi:hypothetical protein
MLVSVVCKLGWYRRKFCNDFHAAFSLVGAGEPRSAKYGWDVAFSGTPRILYVMNLGRYCVVTISMLKIVDGTGVYCAQYDVASDDPSNCGRNGCDNR